MNLPVKVFLPAEPERTQHAGPVEYETRTRDVSFRGMYFIADAAFTPGSTLEFILTLPREVTLAGDVHIRCTGSVVRVDELEGRCGVAARIERFEYLPAPA